MGMFKSFGYDLASRGLAARFAADSTPQACYLNLNGMEVRQENALSSAFGSEMITKNGSAGAPLPLGDLNVHTLGRLKSLVNTYRYAGAGVNLYRRTGDTPGAYTQINGLNALSGNRFSMAEYRPDFSAVPYSFFADSLQMLKDNGTDFSAWGIAPPTIPPSMSLATPGLKTIELFEANAGFTYVNFTGPAVIARVTTTLGAPVSPGVVVVTPAAMTNIVEGMILVIDGGTGSAENVLVNAVTKTTFSAQFANSHLAAGTVVGNAIQGAVAANTTATVTKAAAVDLSTFGTITSLSDDEITLFVRVNAPQNIDEIRLMFDVGDGSFTQDYYWKAISQNAAQSWVSGNKLARDVITDGLFDRSIGGVDNRERVLELRDAFPDRGGELLPRNQQLAGMRPRQLASGASRYSRIRIKLQEFHRVGVAGSAAADWSAVNSFRVSIKTNATGGASVALDDLFIAGGGGPDVFAGVNYDYRYTYFNINTGCESNPSQTIMEDYWVAPKKHAVRLTWNPSPDSQVTHVRLYRRGGTLPTGWSRVAQIAIGTTTYDDYMSDSTAALQSLLEIDNDPPVTTTLKVAVDTTLGTAVTAQSTQTVTPGDITNIFPGQYVTVDINFLQETVLVQSVATGPGQFTAYFQYAHSGAAKVSASTRPQTPMPLALSAASRMWLAGDANNPHILYYGKNNRPESFSPAGYIEIGKPSDPIMGLLDIRGNIFVLTRSTIYQILAVGTPVPVPIKTASTRGLVANFAYTAIDGQILFLSDDGVYAFNGYYSTPVSGLVDWVFQNKAYGPVLPINPANIQDTIFAGNNRELFIAYTDTNSVRRRIIFDTMNQRWRNDAKAATSMCYERDTSTFVFGLGDGTIRQDRTNDYEDAGSGTTTGVTVNLLTEYMDQGSPRNEKIYQNFGIDINTQGQDVPLVLKFNNGAISVNIGNVNTTTRTLVNVPISAGLGQKARNLALAVDTAVTARVDIFKVHVDATVEPEERKSFDTWWEPFGTDEWKVLKQGWFEYQSTAAVNFDCYIDGGTVPEFSFTLSAQAARGAKLVKFPDTMAKLFRFVANSSADFQIFPATRVSIKPAGGPRGWSPAPLSAGEGT